MPKRTSPRMSLSSNGVVTIDGTVTTNLAKKRQPTKAAQPINRPAPQTLVDEWVFWC